jgi:hypothetical protein
MEPHKSDSLAQRMAEPLVLAELNTTLKLELRPGVIKLPNGTRVQRPCWEVERVFCSRTNSPEDG